MHIWHKIYLLLFNNRCFVNVQKRMQSRLDVLEPEQRTDEVASTVFREVLGHRPGYARGLGEMVIPESSRQHDRLKMQQYLAEIERQKHEGEQCRKDAEQYKSQLDEMSEMRDIRAADAD